MCTSNTSTTTVVTVLAKMNTAANPTKRRSVDRSVVMRDSSWPDGQRSWKDTGSRCRWANRSRRMSVSMPSADVAITLRRR